MEAIARIFVGFEDFVGFSGSAFGIYLHALRGSQPASQPATASQPAMGGSRGARLLLLVLSLASVLVCARGQNGTVNVIANGTANGTVNSTTVPVYLYPSCDGVEIVYQLQQVVEISPNATNPVNQPYRFESNLTVNNKGYSTVDTWGVGFNWVNREILVSASGDSGTLMLEDGSAFPANVSQGCVLSPSSTIILHNQIETAGDITQSQKSFTLIGTEFGNKVEPMPSTFNFTSPGYNCSTPKKFGNDTMHSCCLEPNNTITLTSDETFHTPVYGDFTITYDVLAAYTSNYRAKVTISNNSPVGRLDNWALNWTWQEGEFIYSMQGARPKLADTQVCVSGLAATTYPPSATFDVNNALSCSVSPEISDLPLTEANDTTLGNVPYCCRNGTILPDIIDPSKSKSVFTMNVFKLPPHNIDALDLIPPASFHLVNSSYTCGPPQLIAPSLFPDPVLDYTVTAQKTWQVSCNVTTGPKKPPPKCCVSFSTYLNDSIVPCPTYACGVLPNPNPAQCSTNASAMLLPYSALTIRPENRTAQILAWANILHEQVPDPLPCPDDCGVAINWHIVSDYTKGWSARMSLFGWSNVTYPDWFAVVDMPKAMAGYENTYTFNGTLVPPTNTSLVVQGKPGYNNYLLGSDQAKTGVSVLQSVISFTKASTPGIDVKGGAGFPSSVWFNGDECALPDTWPTSGALRVTPTAFVGALLLLLGTLLFGPLELLLL